MQQKLLYVQCPAWSLGNVISVCFDVSIYIKLGLGGWEWIQKGFLSYQTLFDSVMLALNVGSRSCPSYGFYGFGQENNPHPATAEFLFSSRL